MSVSTNSVSASNVSARSVSTKGHHNKLAFPIWALFLIVLLAGCTDPRQALAPPEADVEGIQTVVVFSVANDTSEQDIAAPAEAGLVQKLGAIGWYEIISPERVAQHMAERGIEPFETGIDSQAWNEIARDTALDLDADGFILSVILDLNEDVQLGDGYMVEGADGVEWFADQRTVATVTWRGKLVNAHTGAVVYERTVVGEGFVVDARMLNWVIPESPPANVIPRPHRRDLPTARERAVADALDKFTRDILPRVPDQTESSTRPKATTQPESAT